MAIAPAAFGAIFNLGPNRSPFFAPKIGSTATKADFAWQQRFQMGHKVQALQIRQYYLKTNFVLDKTTLAPHNTLEKTGFPHKR
ncbi:MAG: hypothetical protein PHV02_15665 [Rhodocyclaceae bacterium]|nr:hypothetical protein [Rhodocyclaceae bacterium]